MFLRIAYDIESRFGAIRGRLLWLSHGDSANGGEQRRRNPELATHRGHFLVPGLAFFAAMILRAASGYMDSAPPRVTVIGRS